MSLLDEEKLFYERFYALHRDKQLLDICERFGIAAFRRSSVLENFANIVQEFGLSGRRCIEIGTCNGLTALILARHFDEILTVDIAPNDLKHEIIEFCDVKNIVSIDCKNNEEKTALLKDVECDAAYIDGDHAKDTLLDFDLVKQCGCVLFHEYWEAQPAVWNLVNRLRPNIKTSGKFALWTNPAAEQRH